MKTKDRRFQIGDACDWPRHGDGERSLFEEMRGIGLAVYSYGSENCVQFFCKFEIVSKFKRTLSQGNQNQ